MSDTVISTLSASAPRRVTAITVMAALALLAIYMGFSLPAGLSQVGVLAFGILALFATVRLYQSSAQVIELTESELRIKGGDVLAEMSDVVKVERGAFAFKPSNGFLLVLKTPRPRRWSIGMFWVLGRKIGVGGVTGAPQSKGMAEAIATLIALRDAG